MIPVFFSFFFFSGTKLNFLMRIFANPTKSNSIFKIRFALVLKMQIKGVVNYAACRRQSQIQYASEEWFRYFYIPLIFGNALYTLHYLCLVQESIKFVRMYTTPPRKGLR